jgi:hypothetical protein
MADTFVHRLMGAAMLQPETYEDVEADTSATSQALAVVVFSSLAAGIGAKGWSGAPATLSFFASASVLALITWATWALLMYEVGARILPRPETRVDVGQLLRTLGFAATPGLIQVAGIFPGTTTAVFVVAAIWTLAATVMAVRQALDYTSTARAIAVCALGWLLSIAVTAIIGLVFSANVGG